MTAPKTPRAKSATTKPETAYARSIARHKRKDIPPLHLGPDPGPVAVGELADDGPNMIAHTLRVMMIMLTETRDAIRDSVKPKMDEMSDRIGLIESQQTKHGRQLGLIEERQISSNTNMNDRLAAVEKRMTEFETKLAEMMR